VTAWFETGRVIDLILLVTAVEAALLAFIPKLRGAMSRIDVLGLLAPGVMLMLALRAEMTGAPKTMTAAWLAAAFVFHLADVARRRAARGGD